MRFAPRTNPAPLFAALGAALLVLCILMAAGPGEVFAALPLIALVVALVFRRYPGESLIARLAERFRRRRPRSASSPAPDRVPARWPRPALAALATVRSLRGPPLSSRYSI